MARIDKVSMIVRAIAGTVLSGVQAVAMDAGGSAILAGTANAVGVTCVAGTISAGKPVGILVAGEIVEFGGSAGGSYFSAGGGTVGTTGSTKVGFTVEASRLVVRM